MIAKAKTGAGFGGLARYLEAGSPGKGLERVEWAEARNLPTSEPKLAAQMMRATANLNQRVEKPVYHLSISFDPADQVTPESMRQVVDTTLKDLGLQDHQALLVAHNDTDHRHVHVMVNRVHPETGKTWDNGHDYARIEKSLREQERALGLREVPGHHHRLESQIAPDRTGPTSGQLRQAERTGERSFDDRVRDAAGKDFGEAKGWRDLAQRLDRHGLRLEARGRGLVVTDGHNVAKASSIARSASRASLEKRFGAFDREAVQIDRPAPASVPEVPADPYAKHEQQIRQSLKGLERFEALSSDVHRAQLGVKDAMEKMKGLEGIASGREVRQSGVYLDQTLAEVYRDPAQARQRLDQMIGQEGPERAMQRVSQRIDALGPVKGTRFGPLASQERKAAEMAHTRIGGDVARVVGAQGRMQAAQTQLGPMLAQRDMAKARLDQSERQFQKEMPRGITPEHFHQQIRAAVRAMGPERSAGLAVKLDKERGQSISVQGETVRSAVRDVRRKLKMNRELDIRKEIEIGKDPHERGRYDESWKRDLERERTRDRGLGL